MDSLEHPRWEEIEYLRQALLGARDGVTEQVKWNAPSFCFEGEDRITFRQPGDRVELIFHRGAKVMDATGFQFDDAGLLDWKAADRASISFSDLEDIRDRESALVDIARRWFAVT